MKALRALALAFAILAAAIPFIYSQTSEGRILGTVYDQSGAVVAGANVTITNTATGVIRQLVTSGAGEYVAPNLEPGSYTVEAERAGFKRAASTPLVLEVSRDVRMDLKLQPGAATETVQVTGEGSLADTTDATLNGVLFEQSNLGASGARARLSELAGASPRSAADSRRRIPLGHFE